MLKDLFLNPGPNTSSCVTTVSQKEARSLRKDLFSFLDGLFQDVVEVVFDANLRGIQPGQSTGFHTDSVSSSIRMRIGQNLTVVGGAAMSRDVL